jgi:hypothetical protein
VIDPCLKGEDPVAEFFDGEGGRPEIVREGDEGRRVPLVFAGVPVKEAASNVVVSVAKDGSGHGDHIAEDSSNRIAAAINLRLNLFDYNAFPAFDRFHITQIFRCMVLLPC